MHQNALVYILALTILELYSVEVEIFFYLPYSPTIHAYFRVLIK